MRCLAARMARSLPSWRSFGRTKRMPLCRCSVLYQRMKLSTHIVASAISANGFFGYPGRYFIVRKRASENGLSSLTLGRLKDATTPRRCNVASMVDPFIGPPLSACKTRELRTTPSRVQADSTRSDARDGDSTSWTPKATTLRLKTSRTRYRKKKTPRTGLRKYVMSQDQTVFGAVATCSGGRRCVRGRDGSRGFISPCSCSTREKI